MKQFFKTIKEDFVNTSNLGVIAVSLSIAIFLFWIPMEEKAMFSKNAFWNFWFGIYLFCIMLQMGQRESAVQERKIILLITYLFFCIGVSFGLAFFSVVFDKGFTIGKMFFFTALIFDLIGRYFTKKYGHFV